MSDVPAKPENPGDSNGGTLVRPQSSIEDLAASSALTMNRKAEDSVAVGTVLNGKYKLEKQIGSGGMSIVYLARDLEHERVAQEEQFVAVKVLRAACRDDPDLVRALFEEVKRAQVLAGPHIVSVYSCQYDGSIVYMTMQYLEGTTLDRLIEQEFSRGMPWERAQSLIEGIGRGLADAHDHGIIHCDLKPANIFITSAWIPKILDFGIASAARGDKGGTLGLTREYASPEAIRAWDEQSTSSSGYRPSERDDIYSFACLSYELLAGRRPFEPDDAERARQMHRSYTSVPGLSRGQNKSLETALAFRPESRSARVEDFVEGLRGGRKTLSKTFWLLGTALVIVLGGGVAYLTTRGERLKSPVSLDGGVVRPPDASVAQPRVYGRGLLKKLGVDSAFLSPDGTTTKKELLAMLEKSPRQVQLGSTPDEVQAAVNQCRQFEKGCQLEWYSDETSRAVTLSPFTLDDDAATIDDFRQFVSATNYKTVAERAGFAYEVRNGVLQKVAGGSWQNAVNQKRVDGQWPVVGVTFADAEAYCHWKNERLPTEDEWEYAARGPDRHVFPWGNDVAPALVHREFPFTVGQGPPPPGGYGYRDMSGVVWQWVNTSDGERKFLKGGSWVDPNPANRRAAMRRSERAEIADADSGFRCAVTAAAWPDAGFWLKEARE